MWPQKESVANVFFTTQNKKITCLRFILRAQFCWFWKAEVRLNRILPSLSGVSMNHVFGFLQRLHSDTKHKNSLFWFFAFWRFYWHLKKIEREKITRQTKSHFEAFFCWGEPSKLKMKCHRGGTDCSLK